MKAELWCERIFAYRGRSNKSHTSKSGNNNNETKEDSGKIEERVDFSRGVTNESVIGYILAFSPHTHTHTLSGNLLHLQSLFVGKK